MVIRQRLVLKWISQRIIYFLGDKNRIMLDEGLIETSYSDGSFSCHCLRGKH